MTISLKNVSYSLTRLHLFPENKVVRMMKDGKARMGFRNDINGLRAWAVTVVILYHFGIPGFGGGFVGVDVFFVISGFLMSGIVIKGLERGVFSVLGFYIARARRILPALLALCAVLLALGWFVLLPPDYKQLASDSIYAMLFLSNIEFWQQAGYFDVASHEKWLLHTWSLSVEWQFYLLLPLFQLCVWRAKPGRAAQLFALSLSLIASLVASVWITYTQPSAAFYLLHTRAWEMLAGGLVFLLAAHINLSDAMRRVLEATGLVFIFFAVVLFNKDSAWPGWRAVLPVVAAMLVLLANRNSIFTASKLPQWLGDRSYSLYLWHWPVVVALVYMGLQDNPFAIAAGILLTALLGHGSYAWIENTSRRFLEQRRLPYAAVGLALTTVVVALSAVGVWHQSGVPGRFPPAVELAAAESNNWNQRRDECHPSAGQIMPNCVYGGDKWKVIVVGDSHVSALITGLAKAQPDGTAGAVQWSYSGCAYVPGMKQLPTKSGRIGGKDYKCAEFIEWASAGFKTLPSDIPVVIINRYASGAFGANEMKVVSNVPEVFFSKVHTHTSTEFLNEYSQHITQSACKLAKQRTVYMVRPIPEMGFNVPKTLSRRMAAGIYGDLFITLGDYQHRNSWVWDAQNAARDQCGIRILDPTRFLCRDGHCFGSLDGRPLYYDDDHLSEFGNKLLVPMFAEVYLSL
jgi:peptidoglycan/LPS O-acetylase OafA/YrhL